MISTVYLPSFGYKIAETLRYIHLFYMPSYTYTMPCQGRTLCALPMTANDSERVMRRGGGSHRLGITTTSWQQSCTLLTIAVNLLLLLLLFARRRRRRHLD